MRDIDVLQCAIPQSTRLRNILCTIQIMMRRCQQLVCLAEAIMWAQPAIDGKGIGVALAIVDGCALDLVDGRIDLANSHIVIMTNRSP
jgi:hypothetical protein